MKSLLCAALMLLTIPAQAGPLRVVADILPVHGLVAAVLGDAGELSSIIPAGASAHDFALRPSTARLISRADITFRVGPQLLPWLEDPLFKLAPSAAHHALPNGRHSLTGHTRIKHSENEHTHSGHGQNKQSRNEHEYKEHSHRETVSSADPHRWLNPRIATQWASHIAKELSKSDPVNAPAYNANAANLTRSIAKTTQQITSLLAPYKNKPYMVYHNAYAAFENHFGLAHIGSITDGHAARPGAAHLRELQNLAKHHSVRCLIIDTPEPKPLARQMATSASMKIVYADPLGTQFAPDANHYTLMLTHIASTLVECLGD